MKTEYEYYDAIGPDGEKKPGINQIIYEIDDKGNKTEITRNYLPEGKPNFDLSHQDFEKLKYLLDKINNPQ